MSHNITKKELLSIITLDESLQNEIIFNEWESVSHQEKCINIGDSILDAISKFKKQKQREHQAGLALKVNHITAIKNQAMDGVSFDNQRLMGG